ncbi:hypothetical protein LTR85_002689 [Meristemomyces frigidus]|nr:hypothetical protein LTR85_002689 [Meristemomyces frigidus]
MNATITAAQRMVVSFFGQIFSTHVDTVANETVVAATQQAPTTFLAQILQSPKDVVTGAFDLFVLIMRIVPEIPAALLAAFLNAGWYLGVGLGILLLFLLPFLCWMGIWFSILPMVLHDRSNVETGAVMATTLSQIAQMPVFAIWSEGDTGKVDAITLIAMTVSSFLAVLTGIVLIALAVAAIALLVLAARWVVRTTVNGVAIVRNFFEQPPSKVSTEGNNLVEEAAITSKGKTRECEGQKRAA